MKTVSKILSVVVLLVVLVVSTLPAAAQTTSSRTVTITEDQINNSFRVTNPVRRAVSNVSVDLQPGKAVISATVTLRGRSPAATVTTCVPRIENGRLYWSATEALVNGQPASADLLRQINTSITSSWVNYMKRQAGIGRISALEITADAVIITYAAR